VFVVTAVVVAGSAVARYADTHIAAPVAPSRVAPQLPQTSPSSQFVQGDDRIAFITTEGAGELVLVDRSWSETGRTPPLSGNYLRVEIELVCSSGVVAYSPDNFQAFDSSGFQVDVSTDGIDGPVLGMGTLQVGEHVQGAMAFDMVRGEATLLMSDGLDQTVTALKIPQ
jgi:hypothetical protein